MEKTVRWHQRGAGVKRVTEYNKCLHTMCFIRMSGLPPLYLLQSQLLCSSRVTRLVAVVLQESGFYRAEPVAPKSTGRQLGRPSHALLCMREIDM